MRTLPLLHQAAEKFISGSLSSHFTSCTVAIACGHDAESIFCSGLMTESRIRQIKTRQTKIITLVATKKPLCYIITYIIS